MISENKNGRGLCTTCNNAPSCFHRARRGPVQLCETFDDYVPPIVRGGDRVTIPAATPPVADGAPEEDSRA